MTTPLPCILAGLFLAAIAPAYGGASTELSSKAGPVPVPVPAANPRCFADGVLCFEFEERLRFEVRENNFDFDNLINAHTDDAWLLNRFRLGMTFKPSHWLKFYAQGQDSREWFSDRPHFPGTQGAEGQNTFDLRQAYVTLGDPKLFPLTATIGRQVLAYGDERLVGPSDWNNFARTFDAVRVRFEQPHWWLEAFTASEVVITRDEFDKSDLFNGNERRRDLVFSGLYFSNTSLPATTIDLYAFALDERHGNDSNTEGSLELPRPGAAPAQGGDPEARTDFATYGTRIKLNPKQLGGFEADVEAAGQAGKVAGLDLQAVAVHAGVGYNFYHVWSEPRIYAEYNYASGDSDPHDHKDGTFQNLFPTNHRYYGYMDLFSWQNLHNPVLSLRCAPLPKVTVQVDGHAFFAASNEDAWYRSNGVTRVRPIASEANLYEGAELDVTVRYSPFHSLTLQAGYSHFAAGDFLRATGRSDDAEFGYFMATVNY